MNKPNLYIFVGAPASGKSYWAEHHMNEHTKWISRDAIRFSIMKENDDYFQNESKVYKTFIHQIQEALDSGFDVFADATHINWASRSKLLNALHLDNVNVNCIVFKAPLELCEQRNIARPGLACVPAKILRNMYGRTQHPKTDPYKYNKIITIKTGDET